MIKNTMEQYSQMAMFMHSHFLLPKKMSFMFYKKIFKKVLDFCVRICYNRLIERRWENGKEKKENNQRRLAERIDWFPNRISALDNR